MKIAYKNNFMKSFNSIMNTILCFDNIIPSFYFKITYNKFKCAILQMEFKFSTSANLNIHTFEKYMYIKMDN